MIEHEGIVNLLVPIAPRLSWWGGSFVILQIKSGSWPNGMKLASEPLLY